MNLRNSMDLRKSRLPRWFGHTAIALPPWVTLYDQERYEAMSERRRTRLRHHELMHWFQYDRLGFWRCYAGYIIQWIRHPKNHDARPREIEARAFAEQRDQDIYG